MNVLNTADFISYDKSRDEQSKAEGMTHRMPKAEIVMMSPFPSHRQEGPGGPGWRCLLIWKLQVLFVLYAPDLDLVTWSQINTKETWDVTMRPVKAQDNLSLKEGSRNIWPFKKKNPTPMEEKLQFM